MKFLLLDFKRHERFFRNNKTKQLLIPFFSPVSRYVMKTLYSPMQVVR